MKVLPRRPWPPVTRPKPGLALALVAIGFVFALFVLISHQGFVHLGGYVWTAIEMVGSVVMVDCVLDALQDRRFLRSLGYNGRLEIAVNGNIRAARNRLVFAIGNVILGAWAVYRKNPLVADWFDVACGIWLTGFQLSLVVISIQERGDRRKSALYPNKPGDLQRTATAATATAATLAADAANAAVDAANTTKLAADLTSRAADAAVDAAKTRAPESPAPPH